MKQFSTNIDNSILCIGGEKRVEIDLEIRTTTTTTAAPATAEIKNNI